MSNFEEAFKRIVDEEAGRRMKQGVKQGIKQGVKQGLKQGIVQVAKQTIKNNFTVEQIELTTKLTKKEIEKLKLQVV